MELREGLVRKGGLSDPPTSPRPKTPPAGHRTPEPIDRGFSAVHPRPPRIAPSAERIAGLRHGARLAQRLLDFADELEEPSPDPGATALGLRALAEIHGGPLGEVYDSLRDHRERIAPYCDITIKVQDGRPVLVEITTKHKPTA